MEIQFFWLPIGQNYITCQSTKRHAYPWRSRWRERSNTKHLLTERSKIKHLLTGQYDIWSARARQLRKFKVQKPTRRSKAYSLFFLGHRFFFHFDTGYNNKSLIYWNLGKTVCFVDRRPLVVVLGCASCNNDRLGSPKHTVSLSGSK